MLYYLLVSTEIYYVFLFVVYEILVFYVIVICLVLIFVRFRGLGFVSHDSLSIFWVYYISLILYDN
ncbi:hypothetical protein Hanom_Chr09g00842331 [Helianthus anomalus]